MTQEIAIIPADEWRTRLAVMSDPREVKEAHDHLLTAEELARRLGMDKGLILEAQIAARHAEVRLGDMLGEMDKHPGGNNTPLDDQRGLPPKLAELGVSYFNSSRWQAIARWVSAEPEAYETLIAKYRQAGEDAFYSGFVYGQAMAWDKHKKWGDTVRGLQPVTDARTIVADPPWPYDDKATRGAASDHYETMTVDEIMQYAVNGIAVADMAAEQAHLYLWTPGRHLREGQAVAVVRAWGFEPACMLTWVKPQRGIGKWFRAATEYVIFATRDGLPLLDQKHAIGDWFQADRRRHSEKPEAFYAITERVSPEPRLELFGRRERPGWTVWGDETWGSEV